ncbi:MAG: hypothetical protein Q7J57_16565, partial [Gemmobacter sp.]|nr:hypothetical protein [Gemmobacter sp.]
MTAVVPAEPLNVMLSVDPAPPDSVPMTIPPKVTEFPENPTCPSPVPSLRTEMTSSANRPLTVRVDPPRPLLPAVRTTSVSSNCGKA